MARKKRASIIGKLKNAASDVADALSVAATGSQIGILEMAAEEEFTPRRSAKRNRKAKVTGKKQVASKKLGKKAKVKRSAKHRKR